MEKSKFICCYLYGNFGMTVYDSKEEFVENFSSMFELFDFDELITEMRLDGSYEIIEIKGDCELDFIVE
jgi:hypothetical protein